MLSSPKAFGIMFKLVRAWHNGYVRDYCAKRKKFYPNNGQVHSNQKGEEMLAMLCTIPTLPTPASHISSEPASRHSFYQDSYARISISAYTAGRRTLPGGGNRREEDRFYHYIALSTLFIIVSSGRSLCFKKDH